MPRKLLSDEEKRERKRAYDREYRLNNIERIKARQAAYRADSRDKVKAGQKAAVAKNRAHYTKKSAEWRLENRERALTQKRAYYARNKGAVISRTRKRRAKIRQQEIRLPAADRMEMEAMYMFCTLFPQYEVDHIIPLNGKHVSGLHVVGNLQVLLKSSNRSKGAKFDLEHYNSNTVEGVLFA